MWVFHAVRRGIDPGGRRFRPRFVGVVDVWKDLRSGDGTLSFPGGAGSCWLYRYGWNITRSVPTF